MAAARLRWWQGWTAEDVRDLTAEVLWAILYVAVAAAYLLIIGAFLASFAR